MPVVFRERGFRFFFYSNEGSPREPVHIHVEKDDVEAKFWLNPEVRVPYNDATTPALFASCWQLSKVAKAKSKGHGMSVSPSAKQVRFDADSMWVDLSDGRTLGVPLAWFRRLLHGTSEQRDQVRITSRGLHWDALDEDISVQGLLAGLGDQSAPNKTFAA